MQDKALIEKLNKVITKRFLKMLEEEASTNPDAYEGFYHEFSLFLKEGAALDFSHRDQLMKLLRFESTSLEKGKTTSLADYVSRMGSDQTDIYYVMGANRESVESGPYLEAFKARNIEVLFCYEPVDEYVMNNVRQFDGKTLTAADSADVKLGELTSADNSEALTGDDLTGLTDWLKETLGTNVDSVQVGERLVDSPVLAVNADPGMTAQMRRMMKAMNKDGPEMAVRVKLEINPRHTLIKRLATLRTESPEKAALVASQMLDNALISAGLLEDPTKMLNRLYKLLEQV
jgi:molecular chaperone HtpG